jgi:pimeloyl-[acyl-carrier protein] methyl ester esterase
MQVAVRGTGPALVMIHGWAMHGGVFEPLLARLQNQFALHLVDLPGHGRSRDSTVPLTLEAMANAIASRTPPAPWLGWSLGGLVALHAASSLPASVRGLLMLAASPRFVRAPDWPAGMDDAVFAGFARDLAGDYRGAVDRFLMLEAQGSDHLREELRLLRAIVFAQGEPTPSALANGLALLRDTDLRGALPALAMPSLWLAGRRDRLVSPAAMQAAAQLAPSSQYLEIAGAGHAPFLTHAEPVTQAILEFCRGLPA